MPPDDSDPIPPTFPEDPLDDSDAEDGADAQPPEDPAAPEPSDPAPPASPFEDSSTEQSGADSGGAESGRDEPEGPPEWARTEEGEEAEPDGLEPALPIAELSAKQITFAALFTELVLMLIAVVVIWLADIDLAAMLEATGADWLEGIAWALGFLVLNGVISWLAFRLDLLRGLKELLVRVWYPLAKKLSVVQILLLSLFAGVCEEFFFRGAFQMLIEQTFGWGPMWGVILTGALFGLLHAPPGREGNLPLFLYYGVFGAFISVIFVTSGHNLAVVVVLHFLYDLLALLAMKYLDLDLELEETEDQS